MPNPYMVPATVRCAAPGCKNVRGENNHWFVLLPETDQKLFEMFRYAESLVRNFPRAMPLCGEACALKVMSEQLQKPWPSETVAVIPHKGARALEDES